MDKLAKLMQDIAILWDKYHAMYLRGMLSTLGLALAATAIGCIIGLACGILNTIPCSKNDPWPKRILLKILRVIIRIYVEVFRGTPMVLQAVFVYYGLPYFTDNALRFDNIWAASILIVSINTGAYMAESVRGGIISIDPGQTEGAKAIGMTHVQTMTSVIMPQAIRNILPRSATTLSSMSRIRPSCSSSASRSSLRRTAILSASTICISRPPSSRWPATSS